MHRYLILAFSGANHRRAERRRKAEETRRLDAIAMYELGYPPATRSEVQAILSIRED